MWNMPMSETLPQPPVDKTTLLTYLDQCGFSCSTHEHPPLFTVEDSQKLRGELEGGHTKNLFLKDKKGNFWITGRLDDVLNVAGHRLGTAEIESALVAHKAVAEAAAIGKPHEIKGQAVVAFVTLKGDFEPTDETAKILRNHVGATIGAIAKPDNVYFAPEGLPKTRSGKIMRRLLKELVNTGKVTGNITTLEDHGVIAALQAQLKK